MRKLASVEKIISLEPIKGKDRIELATILGWHVIVQKGDFDVGSICVYVEYDTVLPMNINISDDFKQILKKRCYSSRYNGLRIRNMKMAGVFSEGIVFPMSILAGDFGRFNEGREVAEELGIRRYDIEELKEIEKAKTSKNPLYKHFMKYKWFRKLVLSRKPKGGYPESIHKSDEKNIQTEFKRLWHENYTYYKGEKLEGQSATFEKPNLKKFNVYSHNVRLPKPDTGNWWRTAKRFDIDKKMKIFMKNNHMKSIAVQGEICGPGIQRNIYGFNDLEFFVFNVRNTKDKQDFSFYGMKDFCKQTGLRMVPILETNVHLPETCDEILADADGQSSLKPDQIREGIVWRTMSGIEKISFKAKSPKYKIWWDKKEITE